MAIAKLPKNAQEFIAQGGSIPQKPKQLTQEPTDDSESCRIILRMPKRLLSLLDNERKKRPSQPYRNQLELLDDALKALGTTE